MATTRKAAAKATTEKTDVEPTASETVDTPDEAPVDTPPVEDAPPTTEDTPVVVDVSPTPAEKARVTKLANEVNEGEWGKSTVEQSRRLASAGYDATAVIARAEELKETND